MTVQWNRQYRPVATIEAATNDGLSVRAIRDLADSLNNYGRHFCSKLISQLCIPPWMSKDAAIVTEQILAMWPPFLVPDGPSHLTTTMSHMRTAGAGNVTFRLYVSRIPYSGDVILNTALLSPSGNYTSIICNQGTWDIDVTQDLVIPHAWNEQRICYLILTGQNTLGSRAQLGSIDVTPKWV
jgi:hypothetical protein